MRLLVWLEYRRKFKGSAMTGIILKGEPIQ